MPLDIYVRFIETCRRVVGAGGLIALLFTGLAMAVSPAIAQNALDLAPFKAKPNDLLDAVRQKKAPEDADVWVLREAIERSFDKSGVQSRTSHIISYVVTESGIASSETITASWSPWYQKQPVIKARVITSDGEEHWLDPETIGEASDDTSRDRVFTDTRRLRGPLPAVAQGVVIEWLIESAETEPFFDAGVSYMNYLIDNDPVEKLRVIYDAPSSLPLKYKVLKLDDLQPRREEKGGRVRLTFEVGPVEAAKGAGDGLPSDVPRWPAVVASTAESWQAIATRYAQIVSEQLSGAELPASLMIEDVGEMARGDVIRTLTARLHEQIRYTGIEFSQASYVPRRPAETLERKFGDCKDKAALLVAMLDKAGIPAHVALLRTGPGQDIDPEAPGFGRFDHAIVYVPGQQGIWIDATVDDARPGQLPLADQDRYALVASPDTTALIRTPAPMPDDNRTIETREFFLSDLGKARVVEVTKVHGKFELDYRGSFVGLTNEEIGEQLESYVDNAYLAKQAPKVTVSGLDDLTEEVNMRLDIEEAGRGVTDTAEAVVAIRLESLLDSFPTKLSTEVGEDEDPREHDYVIDVPYIHEWEYRITPPAGFQVRDLPESERIEMGPAYLSREFEADADGAVKATFRFSTGKRRYTPEQVSETRAATSKFLESTVVSVLFDQVGEVHLKSGRIKEALSAFRSLTQAHPENALHRGRVARALLAAGLGEAAREEARKAVELDPESKTGHQNLGWILQHDLIGRRFEKGFDLDGAVEAYRKAHEADPEDNVIQFDLAILLEHNEEGFRYAKGSRMDEAIVEYRDLLERLENNMEVQNSLVVALLRAKRFDDLAAQLREIESKDARIHAIEISSRAVSENVDRAVDYASQYFAESQERIQALAGAASTLIQVRKYPQAAGLLRAAARDSATAARALSQASLFERTTLYEEVELLPDDPSTPIKELFLTIMAEDRGPEHLMQLLSRHLLDAAESKGESEEGKEVFDEIVGMESMRKLRRQMRTANLPFDVMLDLLLSALDVVVEGDDETGHRLNVSFAFGGASREMVTFVQREGDRYTLLDTHSDTSDDIHGVPLAVIAHVEANKLTSAQTLLDWARELRVPAAGDDPLAGPLLPRFWEKGQQGDAERMKLGAAALMARSKALADRAIPIFERSLEDVVDESLRTPLQLGLALALAQRRRFEDALPLADTLAKAHPKSEAAFRLQIQCLSGLKRYDEARRVIDERLSRLPRDEWALRMRLEVDMVELNLPAMNESVEMLRNSGKLHYGDLNNYAWTALVSEALDDEVVRAVERAVDLSKQQSVTPLHTLASVYADLGKTAEARAVLLQAMNVESLEEPDSKTWYVIGRIAEHYGVPEAARTAYGRVERPEKHKPYDTSVHALAQRRLGQLN